MIKLFEFCRKYGMEIHTRYEPKEDLVYCDFYNPRTNFTYIHYIKGESLRYLKDTTDFEDRFLEDVKTRLLMHSEVMPDVMDR